MAYRDLREFIARLEKEGEVQRIEEEVNWNLEAGAMARRAMEEGLPAPFFLKMKGYPEGYRLFSGTLAKFSRIAIALGMKPDTHPRELIEEYLRRKQKPIKPVFVKDGPCKENVHVGDAVDLLEFPVPMIHDGDGGRYIGTWHLTIVKDLDSDWVNWGMYRHMLHNQNTIGILQSSVSKHLWSIYSKGYEPRKRPMEVAIAIGVEPVATLCAGTPFSYGVSEVDIVGGIRQEPVELVKCETVNLMVPSTAEIVIEGEISGDTMIEGPFGEYSGYSSSPPTPRPIIRVKGVTHRNNPILTMCCHGVPIDDGLIWSMTRSAANLDLLRQRGFPVTGVNVIPESAGYILVVGVKASYSGIAADIAHLIWATDTAHAIPYIVVVEDDVDPFNVSQVLHALGSKCHPSRGIVKVEHSPASPLLPSLDCHERQYRTGSTAYFDCTWPLDWAPADIPQKVSFAQSYPSEVQKEALSKWRKYGY